MRYRHLPGPLLFGLTRRDPEQAHAATIALLAAAGKAPVLLRLLRRLWDRDNHPSLARELFGVHFPNPVGLAAGYDKNGTALAALAAVGFGFIEVGTVTWHAQPGNPRPRIFRLPAAGALINRMGFNNAGARAVEAHLHHALPLPIPIGISLGKSRRAPLEEAVDDYCASFRTLAPYGDFFSINISSPNTPDLRRLQERAHLDTLLSALRHESSAVAGEGTSPAPLLVKIAPDLSKQAIIEVLEVCAAHEVSGIIATNTTRVGEGTTRPECESGGLSGRPLAKTARRVVDFISRETGGELPIIGVGGIFSPDDARHMFDAGASLIQLYTGLIYEGPGLVGAIKRMLVERRQETGYRGQENR